MAPTDPDPTLAPPTRMRKHLPILRGHTQSIRRLSQRALREGAEEFPVEINEAFPRPRTLGECEAQGLGTAEHPCPFVACQYHLYLDVDPRNGSIRFNFPDRDPDELEETCAQRVAAHGGASLDAVGRHMNLTRERIRQIEHVAYVKLREHPEADRLEAADGPRGWEVSTDPPGKIGLFRGRETGRAA